MKKNNNKGFSLVTSLGFVAALALIAGSLGLIISNERSKLNYKNKEDRLTLAARSLQTIAIETLKNNALTKFKYLAENYSSSTSTDIIPADTTTQEDQGTGFLTGNLNSITDQNNSTLYNTFNKIGTSNNYIGEPIKFMILFFNDKDNDGTLDVGQEETSYLISKNNSNNKYSYTYSYNITVYTYIGNNFANAKDKRKITTNGNITLSAGKSSFAKYAMFLNKSSGAMFWWGDTIRGPFHSNDKILFAGDVGNSGKSATFYGKVTSASSSIGWYYYQNGGWYNGGTTTPPLSDQNPKLVASNGTVRVAPDFKQGFERGVASIPLPNNSFSQVKAALGNSDTSPTTSLTVAEQRALLGLGPGTSVPDGIYLPAKDSLGNIVNASNPIDNSTTSGGIYIKGNVDSLIMSTPTNPGSDGVLGTPDDYSVQEYLIKQGNTLKRITIDYEAGKTKYETLNPSNNAVISSKTLNSVTNGVIQVDGTINFIGGPPRSNNNDPNTAPPAIHSKNKLTISATGDIIIQRDIKYQTDPRGADGVFGTADDNLNAQNILGFYSSTGNVRIGLQTNRDFTLHGVVMASGTNKGFRVDGYNTRPQSGKIHLLGGTIEDALSPTETTNNTGFGTDYTYDERTGQGLAPPYFPDSGKFGVLDPLIKVESSYEEKLK
jgi:hypothetical protein